MIAQAVQAGRVELADIVREHAGRLPGLSPTQQHVLRAIADCRTPAPGHSGTVTLPKLSARGVVVFTSQRNRFGEH